MFLRLMPAACLVAAAGPHALTALGCNCPPNSTLEWDAPPPGMKDLVANNIAEILN